MSAAGAYDRIAQQIEVVERRTLERMADAVLEEIRATAPVRGRAPTRRRPGRQRGRGGDFRDSFGVAVGAAPVVAGMRAREAMSGYAPGDGVRVASAHPGGRRLARGWSVQAASGWVKRAARAGIARAL